MQKALAIYEKWDPTQEGVTHVAIQTTTEPHYVWRTYFVGEDIPKLGDDISVLSIEQAGRIYEFRRGKISELES